MAKYPKKNTKNKNVLLILKNKMMKYYFNKTLKEDFNSVIKRVTDELKNEGFGILTEIDVKETL